MAIAAKRYDLKDNPIIRGASWQFDFNYTVSDVPEVIYSAQLRYGSASTNATLTALTGNIAFALSATETAAVKTNQVRYFVDIVANNGDDPITLLTGVIPVNG